MAANARRYHDGFEAFRFLALGLWLEITASIVSLVKTPLQSRYGVNRSVIAEVSICSWVTEIRPETAPVLCHPNAAK